MTLSRILVALVSCAVALLATASAFADDYKRAVVASDQAAAKAAVLRKADFAGALPVTRGPATPDDDSHCAYYNPKESDLVLTGEAESVWRGTGFEFTSHATYLRSRQMVATDWRRSLAPGLIRCMKELAQQGLGSSGKVVSIAKLPLPTIGERSYGVRAVADVKASGQTLRMALDFVVFSQGRAEGVLFTVFPYVARNAFAQIELALARVVAARLAPTA